MKQITTSSVAETMQQFSPDGEYLLIGTDFHVTGLFGKIYLINTYLHNAIKTKYINYLRENRGELVHGK